MSRPPLNPSMSRFMSVKDTLDSIPISWHVREASSMIALCCFFHLVVSPRLTSYFFPGKRAAMHSHTRTQWDFRAVSHIHSSFICIMAIWVVMTDQERLGMTSIADRVWGYSERIGKLSAYSIGYHIWDLAVVLWNPRTFSTGTIVHSTCALVLLCACFRPFLHFYTPWFILFELSTPLLHVHWFCDVLKMTGSRIQRYNGIALLTAFTWSRIICGTYQSVAVYGDLWMAYWHKDVPRHDDSTFAQAGYRNSNTVVAQQVSPVQATANFNSVDTVPLSLLLCTSLGVAALNVLNWIWFQKLVHTVRRRFVVNTQHGRPAIATVKGESTDRGFFMMIKRRSLLTLKLFGASTYSAYPRQIVTAVLTFFVAILCDIRDRIGAKDGPKIAPTTEAELAIQRLWASILERDVDSIGTNDNFFQLGGDSVQAVKLVDAAGLQGLQLNVADVFTSPTLAVLAQCVLALETKVDLVPFELLSAPGNDGVEALIKEASEPYNMNRASIEDAYECTPLQEALMIQSTMADSVYIARHIITLSSTIDLERLRAAWEAVVNSAPIFRTRIVPSKTTQGMLQIVVRETLPWMEASDLQEYLQKDKQIPMGFGEPLSRYAIVEEAGSEKRFLVWTVHHAISDGWSLSVVARNLVQIYEGGMVPTPMQFNQFIKYVGSRDTDATEAFWRVQLETSQPSTFPGIPSPGYQPRCDCLHTHTIQLSKPKNAAITMPTRIRAAWAILMGQYENSDCVVIGVTIAGRNAPMSGLQDMLGPVVTTIPVRVNIDRKQRTEAFLEVLQAQSVDTIPFEQYGLQNIRAINSETQAACNFQSLLVVHPIMWSREIQGIGAMEMTSPELANDKTYPIVMECTLTADGIQMDANFDSHLVSKAQVVRLQAQLEEILQQLCWDEDDEATIGQIESISPQDKMDVLSWNSECPKPVHACAHGVVAEQVLTRPDEPAVCGWDAEFTYQQLDELSTRLAHHIISLGVRTETFVPLCFGKSAWTIVAVLAVLKAGGAFVSLDPSHPMARNQHLLREVSATLVLTDSTHDGIFQASVPNSFSVSRATIDQLPVVAGPLPNVLPENPAFVIFTSGSTGNPKGIIIEHGALCSSSKAHAKALGINQASRVMQFAAYTYDVSIGEILTTLMHGGCVCVPTEQNRLDNLAVAINKINVNWLFLTPTVAGLLRPSTVPNLKVLVVGGEHATEDNVRTWVNHVDFINSYGPAECTIWSNCTEKLKLGADCSNIGRRVGCVLWVADVNDSSKLSPVGAIGELLIEGPILARGYLNNAEKTAAAFIENPTWAHSFEPGRRQRFYKTGDLVRYNLDGTLNIIGRKDTQVKLRGQRLELGEVEHQLKKVVPDKWQVTVEMIKPTCQEGDPILAAFVSVEEPEQITVRGNDIAFELIGTVHEKLQEWEHVLVKRLPSYMMPALYIPLYSSPVTTNGKSDRQKLRQLGAQLTAQQLTAFSMGKRSKRSPSTEMEIKLQQLWAGILHLDPSSIGADDSFFRLGGNSIRAMRLVAAAREKGIMLTVAAIFQSPALSEMSKASATLDDKAHLQLEPFSLLSTSSTADEVCEEAAALCGVPRQNIADIYPCAPLQQGLIALSTRQPGTYVAEVSYNLPPDTDIIRFQKAWESMVEDLPILRTRIVETREHGLLQVVLYETVEWSTAADRATYLAQEQHKQMALGQRLSRQAILPGDEGGFVFIWTAHHALYDGWTMDLVLGRVEQYYKGAAAIPQAMQYNRFIQHLQGLDRDLAAKYWRSQLSHAECIQFPMLPSPQHQARTNAMMVHSPQILWKQDFNITIPTILRGAWALVVAEYSGSTDVVFGITMSGRNAPIGGIDSMCGPTINTLPVRIQADHALSVTTFLESTQAQAVEMMRFEGTGLQEIRRLGSEIHDACEFQNILVIQADEQSPKDRALFKNPISSVQHSGFFAHPLTVECVVQDAGVEIKAYYDSRIISSEQMNRVLVHFEHVLQLIATRSTVQLGSIMSISQRDHIDIQRWNSKSPEVVDACVHDLITQKALLHPEAPAITGWDASLNYRELDKLSAKFSSHLRSLGVGVGSQTYVPICFEKSVWAIVAMLAVLKAGGAFVPLDPSRPLSYSQRIIERLEAKILLTSPATRQSYPLEIQNTVEVSYAKAQSLPTSNGILSKSASDPRQIMYVLFTSGSTGEPKGVLVDHVAVSTSIKGHGTAMGFGPESRALQFCSYSFDVSIAEIFTTLVFGGCVCVPSDDDKLDISMAINKMKVNWAFFTPSFVKSIKPQDVPSVKTLVLGGETMSKEDVENWSGVVRLINGYGPTEASIFCLAHDVTPEHNAQTIGQAVGSVSWVVDPSNHDRLVPIGCVGELLIEGALLARGYLNDTEKTRAAFIQDPAWFHSFNSNPNHPRRFYKTGDLVKHNSDGTLDIVGRKDTQVKIRGQRLETSEVEHYLTSDSQIASAMVTVPSKGRFQKRLVAILTLQDSALNSNLSLVSRSLPIDDGALRLLGRSQRKLVTRHLSRVSEHLSSHLPTYMVPEFWIVVEEIPLSVSAKLNRQMVKKWLEEVSEEVYREIADSHIEEASGPETAMDRKISAILARVLNLSLEEIVPSRSFLSLGGDSISAMQMVSRARAEGIDLRIQDLLQSKSISHLAQVAKVSERQLATCQDDVANTIFDLSPIQQMFFELEGQNANQPDHHFNQTFFLRLKQDIQHLDVAHAIEAVVQKHSMLRSRFKRPEQPDGKWSQVITTDVVGSYRLNSHDGIKTDEEMGTIMSSSQRSIDIENGPVFAVNVFEATGNTKNKLLFFVAHHLVIDLVSWRIIFQDIEEMLTSGKFLPPVSPVPFSFQAWSRSQAEYAQRLTPSTVIPFETTPADLGYWGMNENTNINCDTVRESFSLSEEITSILLGDHESALGNEGCHSALGTTPVEVFIGTLFHAFGDTFVNRALPTVFTEGHGREPWDPAIDLSRTVGWFTTMAPIHLSTLTGDDVIDIIKRTKDIYRSLPNKGSSYFASRYLNSEATAFSNHLPMEILFNYLGRYQQLERSDGLLSAEPKPPTVESDLGPAVKRFALFEISVVVMDRALHFHIDYNQKMRHRSGVSVWVKNWQQSLQNAARKLLATEQQKTLSDFPLLSLTYANLENMERNLSSSVVGLKSFAKDVEDIYPCTPMQQGLLLSQTRTPGNYETSFVFEVIASKTKRVDLERLLSAWQEVVSRHTILRTIFVESVSKGGVFDQLVLRHVVARAKKVTRTGAVTDEHALAAVTQQEPMNYGSREPPHLLTVCQSTASGRTFCKVEISHVITDAMSRDLMLRDLNLAYSNKLPAVPAMPYSNYIRFVQSQPVQAAAKFWKKYLTGVTPCFLHRSQDTHVESANPDGTKMLKSIQVYHNIEAGQLQTFCDTHQVTISTILKLAWGLVLKCYADFGTEEICFGYLASGRDVDVDSIEEAVGPFINMLTCRMKMVGMPSSLPDVLQQLQTEYLDAMEHQHYSLAQVQHALKLSSSRFFNTAMSIQRAYSHDVDYETQLQYKGIEGHDPTEYDVFVNGTFSKSHLEVELSYWSTFWTEAQAVNVANTFSRALNYIVEGKDFQANPDLLSDHDKDQIMEWNSEHAQAIESSVHNMITQQVLQSPPGRLAVHGWDASFTYHELDCLSTQLACQLIRHGVGPETFIVLLFEKSAWAIVAMLAVLKAGGAFISLDPSHPLERHISIIKDVNAHIMLRSERQTTASGVALDHVIVVSRNALQKLAQPHGSLSGHKKASPENAAYGVFTSGSSGKPKTVVVSHTALVTSCLAHGKAAGITVDSRVLQFASYTFDISMGDIFCPLLVGGCICIPSHVDLMNRLAGVINEMAVTWMCLTPTVARLIRPEDVPLVKTLVLCGEVVTQDIVTSWSDNLSLHNFYGPAEATIYCSYLLGLNTATPAANIGKGKACALWIVEATDHNQLVPIGRTGELLIEGPVLAREYLNNPVKTTAAFIENTAWSEHFNSSGRPRRFYKTGDLGRYNSDGTIHFVGRKDTQVKLHGQRLELGEVEHQIIQIIPSNWQVVVELISPVSQDGSPILAAFVCTGNSQTKDALSNSTEGDLALSTLDAIYDKKLDLAARLAKSLPSYMVPGIYIPLFEIPMGASRKIDRGNLRQLGARLSRDQLMACSIRVLAKKAPTTEMEVKLQNLWADLLHLEPSSIGVDDNFFQLGGNSVQAMRLVATARETQSISLTVADIFNNPTLAGMSTTTKPLDQTPWGQDLVAPFSLITDSTAVASLRTQAALACNVESAAIEDIYPCTSLQEGLMALSAKRPGAYVLQSVYVLPEYIDLDRFKSAWEAVVEDLAILRTRIIETKDHGLLQVVLNETPEWRSTAADLDNKQMGLGKRLSCQAITHEAERSTFTWTAHHAVYDGWTMRLVLERVEMYYEGASVLPLTHFNRFIKDVQSHDDATDFWRSQLSEASLAQFPSLPSPQYQAVTDSKHVHMAKVNWRPESEFTSSTIIRAAWAIVIAQYTGSSDVVFGLTLSGRNASIPGIDTIAGPTINTLPLHVLVDDSQSIEAYLRAIHTQAIETMPFEQTRLQSIRRMSPKLRDACDFQNILVIQVGTREEGDSMTIFNGPVSNHEQSGFFLNPLTLEVAVYDQEVEMRAYFDSKVITDEQISGVLAHFEHILNQILAGGSHVQITDIKTISQADHSKISNWNRSCPQVVNACVHDLVTQQVLQRPEAMAICGWDTSFTYQELDDLSTRLSYRLIRLGVKPETLVPFCFEKSSWTIVAMLATLKAGGACVALDPRHPIGRLQGIISDLGSDILLCSTANFDKFEGIVSKVVTVSSASTPTWRDSTIPANNFCLARPSNAAFVVFTSGSTGKPKGIVLEHSAFCTSAQEHGKAMRLGTESRVLQFASYTFDVSLGEIFSTLIHGGCICVPSEEDRLNNLAEVINNFDVNWAYLTSSVASLLPPADIPRLKILSVGGEAVTQDVVTNWAESLYLINIYGPAECTVWSTYLGGLAKDTSPNNVGRGVGSVSWVVDPSDYNRLVPIGCVGELLIEGPILARGYMNDTTKTADAFVEDTIWSVGFPTQRRRKFYRTGDLVRFNPDGTLHFVGRKDTQIKFHGQRIELSEIEHNLLANEDVKSAIVLVPEKGHCQDRLIAMIEFRQKSESDPEFTLQPNAEFQPLDKEEKKSSATQISRVQETLHSTLPPYMIPSLWIPVYTIPLNTSGKLDRAKVRQWVCEMDEEAYIHSVVSNTEEDAVDVEPMDAMDYRLRKVLARVLNLPESGIAFNRSFLHLGGDSITAMQVVWRARADGIALRVQDILQSRTVSQLSKVAIASGESSMSQKETLDVAFNLSPIQQMYFETDHKANEIEHHFNQSVFLRLSREVSIESMTKALEVVVAQHSMLRARFKKEDGQWCQIITKDVADSYRFGTHEVMSSDEMAALMLSSQKSLDIQHGPVFGVDIFNLAGNDNGQLLFLTAHHLVVDLVSWRVILQDIEEMLESGVLSAQRPSPFSFQAWCKLQAEHSLQNLNTASKVLPFDVLPADYSYWHMANQDNLHGDTVSESFTIDKHLTNTLLGDCHDALGTEPVEVFIATLLHSFGEIFVDRATPTVLSEGHGREPWDQGIDLSGTVGWFTTMAPIHVPRCNEDVVDTIRRTKDIRRSLPGNGWPYFASRFLTPEGKKAFRSHQPIEILFNYLGRYQQLERKDGLLQPEDYPTAAASSDFGRNVQRFALLDVSVVVIHGKTHFRIEYNKKMYRHRSKISAWTKAWERSLQEAARMLLKMDKERTISDFKLLSLTYANLDTIKNKTLESVGLRGFDEVEDIYPCSPMQQGLLISQIRSPGTYETSFTFEIVPLQPEASSVNVERLLSAWQQVVNRHSILRTVFVESVSSEGFFDQLVRRIYAAKTIQKPTAVTDTQALTSVMEQEPLDYKGYRPPHQLTICQAESGRLFCRLEISHAITDAMSREVMLHDLDLAYHNGSLSNTPPMPYQDYMRFIQDQPIAISMDYWKNYLEGLKPCILPNFQDSATKELKSLKVELDVELERFQAYCDTSRVTISTVLKAVWGLVLRCYTGSEDVCFGYLASGRDIAIDGIEHAVGPFINMLICRMSITGTRPIAEILQHLQADYVDSLKHQHCSLAQIQSQLNMAAESSLFNTAMTIQRTSFDNDNQRSAIDFKEIGGCDPTEYDMIIYGTVSSTSVDVVFNYWTSALTNAQAANIAGTFNKVLQYVLDGDNPDTLDLLSRRDREQILAWNKSCPKAIDACVHDEIALQVLSRPDAPAVCGWDMSFTYSELDELSTRLAHYLAAIGTEPGTFIPVCFEKSAWTIVALLAVIKAGCAFIPLHPSNPLEHSQDIIERTGKAILLTSSKLQKCYHLVSEKIVEVSGSTIYDLPITNTDLQERCDPQQAMYVLFTSGSTGKPKGVVMEHSAAITSIRGHGTLMGFGPNSRVLQFCSYGFDGSIAEIFTTLVFGGCVCIPSDDDRLEDIASTMTNMGVNWAFFTPSFIRLINPESLPTLKTLVLGGEAMSQEDIERWAGRVRLINGYGPTESCVFCVQQEVSAAHGNPRTIGRSISSVSWVVDPTDYNRLAPIGCVGELLVEGPILAREYLNDDEKTTAVFIQDPTWAQSFELGRRRRFYRTGDLVRYNSDGTISIIGRMDSQVKVRGQRLELGQVEYNLKQFVPSQWLVIAELIQPPSREDAILAAFVCTEQVPDERSDLNLDATEMLRSIIPNINEKLATKLPTYMIPAIYIPIHNIPFTTSGKTDRTRLRQIGRDLTAEQITTFTPGQSKRALSTHMERKMQHLWAKVLHREPQSIGADDSFFGLGGDSMQAMRLVAAAREQAIALRVVDIFHNPTLSGMASTCKVSDQKVPQSLAPFSLADPVAVESIHTHGSSEYGIDASSIEDVFQATEFQSLSISAGLRAYRGSTGYFVIDFDSPVDELRMEQACRLLVSHHQILRTVFVVHKERLFQVVLRTPRVDFDCYKQGSGRDAFVHELIEQDKMQEVKLGQSMVRFMLVGNNIEGHSLVFRISHAQYDGTSLPIIFADLEAAYLGRELSDGPSYRSFMGALRSSENSEAEEFWTKRLRGSSMTQFLSPPSLEFRPEARRTISTSIPAVSLTAIDVTLSSIFKTAWALILAKLSGQEDVVFGQFTSGRNISIDGIDRVVGCCVNEIPVRIKIGSGTVLDLLHQVQEEYLSCVQFDSLGLGTITTKCTDWPQSTTFGSVVQHQNEDEAPAFLTFGGQRCTVELIGSTVPSSDVFLLSTSRESEIEVALSWNEGVLPSEFVEGLLEKVCLTVSEIVANTQAPIATLSSVAEFKGCLPFLNKSDQVKAELSYADDQPTTSTSVQSLVNRAWSFVKGGDSEVSSTFDENTPFSDVWTKTISAAHFAHFYKQQGIDITMEEIIEHPTKYLQRVLINRRLQTRSQDS